MDKIMDKLDNRGIRMFCVGFTERKLVLNTFCYSFICLCRAVSVSVSVHYTLCWVTVRMEVLQNRKLTT